MQEKIYQWVRTLAVFYILFTAILQLVPDKKYEPYIRSFMGLLLIYMLLVPAAALFGKSSEFIKDFQLNYQTETAALTERENDDLQAFYLKKGYEREIASEIRKICEDYGIKTEQVTVYIEGEEAVAEIQTAGNPADGEEGRIQDALWQALGIRPENCKLVSGGDGDETVDGGSADRTASDGDRAADVG